MPYCINCGHKLSEGAKFCDECGVPVKQTTGENEKKRTTIFDGEIHKCPNCGAELDSFVSNCTSCGYELRGKSATNSIQQFYRDINKATSSEQKNYLIRNFPIPNTKEDILEFLILASSNILGEDDKYIFEAWSAKFEQGYKKASLLFRKESDFNKIQQIYDDFHMNIENEKNSKINKFAVDILIRNIVVCIAIILMIIAIVINAYRGEGWLFELISGIILIASASSLVKRNAPTVDFAIGAASGATLIVLSYLMRNGALGELCGGIVLIIIAVNYFKSL